MNTKHPLPPQAAGTIVTGTDGTPLVLSGDDAPKWAAFGWNVRPVYVQCSAEVVAGSYPVRDRAVLIAVDLNGEPIETVARLVGDRAPIEAQGAYNGETLPSAVFAVWAADVPGIHEHLTANLSGFGCFAILNTAV